MPHNPDQQIRSKAVKGMPKLTNAAGGNMMISDTDLLFANQLVADDLLEVPEDQVNNYRKYAEKKKKDNAKKKQVNIVKQMNEPIPQVASGSLPDRQQRFVDRLPPAQPLPSGPEGPQNAKTRFVEKKRKIYIDSRHRDKTVWKDASDFVISWGRVYQNVKQIKLVSLEFPNVVQSIGLQNNMLNWINLEDIQLDDPFPVYSAAVNVGSYDLMNLQTELTAQLKKIKRRGGLLDDKGNPPARHLFIVEANLETDYVGFTSIIAQAAGNNPLTTIGGNSKVVFKQKNHGYDDKERIHIIGVMGIVGGLQAADINGAYIITKIDNDTFSFEIQATAVGSTTGGGTLVKSGREAPFQFLFGTEGNNIAEVTGFPIENSGITIAVQDPITSNIKQIVGVIPGEEITQILCPNHGFQAGDRVYLHNTHISPSIYENDRYKGIFSVYAIPSPDVFEIRYYSEKVSDITNAFVGTQSFEMYYPGHGFNRIVDIVQIGPNLVQITTLFDHGFDEKSVVRITGSNSVPNVDGYYVVTPIDEDSFAISSVDAVNPLSISTPGFRGILTSDHTFYLYNVQALGGFTSTDLNNVPFTVRDIKDANTFTFTGNYGFSKMAETGGGGGIRINSKLHGFRGTQNNLVLGERFKPIRLSGDNYAYMCVPGLNSDSISNSGPVQDIFAKLFITANPGLVIFSQFDSSPIDFAKPIPLLEELRFTIKSPDNQTITFNGLDYSFGLELIELVQEDEVNEQASLRMAPPGTVGASRRN